MRSKPMYSAILLAAGSGTRLGSAENKVLLPIGTEKRPVFEFALHTFLKDEKCERVIMVIREQDKAYFDNYLANHTHDQSTVLLVLGGKERQDSVQNGLAALDEFNPEFVFVHDAARPFVTPQILDKLFQSVQENDAAIVGIKAMDSMKQVSGEWVEKSLDRTEILRVQTPQAFSFALLNKAYQKASQEGYRGNEEGELVERLNHKVHVVEGTNLNFKITTSEDLELACALVDSKVKQK